MNGPRIQCSCCDRPRSIDEFEFLKERQLPDERKILVTLKCKSCNKKHPPQKIASTYSRYESDRDELENLLETDNAAQHLKKMKRVYGKVRVDTDPLIPWFCLQWETKGFTQLTERSQREYRRLKAVSTTKEGLRDADKINHYRSNFEFLQREQQDEWMRRKHRRMLTEIALSLLLCLLIIGSMLWLHLSPRVLSDGSYGVSVELDGNEFSLFEKYTVDVRVSKHGHTSSEYAMTEALLRQTCTQFSVYDIFLTRGDRETQPNAPVRVTLPLDASLRRENVTVYYVAPDGKIEELEATVSAINGTVSFFTDHFSLYAIAEKPFTVSFDTDGGSEIATQRHLWGELAEAPSAPSRKGYTFLGWFDPADGHAWEPSAEPVTHNVRLCARWQANGYRLTLDAAGGSLVQSTQSVLFDAPYGALPSPTREGYTFVGWQLGGALIDAATLCQTADDHTLTALWTNQSYTVSLDAAGGECSLSSIEVFFDENYGELPLPTREGYDFAGWQYNDKTVISASVCSLSANHTLTAAWTPKRYLLSFDANGGMGATSHPTVTFGERYGSLPTPTREGYVFLGWSIGERVLTAESICTTAADHTLTAEWTAASYTLSFDSLGGSAVASRTLVFDSAYGTLPSPTREGYGFSHWELEGVRIDAKSLCKIAKDHTLTAVWIADRYTVTFDACEGSMAVIYREAYGTLPVPQKLGYTFLGWSLGGKTVTADTLCVELTDHTLTALWQANTYTVTFETQGGTPLASATVTYGQAYGTLPVPEKEGYHFSFWYINGTVIYSNTVCDIAADHTLTVYWIGNTYTLSFDTDGGNAIAATKVQFGKLYGDLPIPEKVGYEFSHWSLGDTTVGALTPCTTADDHTLVANWTVASFAVSFDPCGGSETEEQRVQFGSTYGSLPNPTREGYTFGGWYFGSMLVTADTVCKLADHHTLTASWTANVYRLTLDACGGALEETERNVLFGAFYAGLPTPTRNGYRFDGWMLGEQAVSPATRCATAADHTLTAKWTPISYSITYALNGGEKTEGAVYPSVYTVEQELWIPNAVYPTYSEYNRFVGWYEDSACTTAFANDLNENPRDLTLYAKWDLCYVYDSIDATPFSLRAVSSGGVSYTRILLDWSHESNPDLLAHRSRNTEGTNRYNNIDVHNSVTEVIFVGGGKTFQNFRMYLCFFEQGNTLRLTFDSFRFISNEATAIAEYQSSGYILQLDVRNTCSIETQLAGGSVLSLANATLTVLGSGDLTVRAKDGANGSDYGVSGQDGGNALLAKMLVLNLNGKLSLFGGDGGNGHVGKDGAHGNPNYNADGSDRDSVGNGANGGNGQDGSRGGDGGNGGLPYNRDVRLILICGDLYAYGGNAGSGANGGTGGNGGRGQESGLWGGTGGNGGNAGAGGDGGNSGHVGMTAYGSLTETNGTLHAQNGSVGSAGKGGNAGAPGPAGTHSHLRDPGKYWGTWGSAGSDGCSASNGNDGTVFYE